MNVIKKDGKQVAFDLNKIKRAVARANKETQELTEADVLDVVNVIHSKLLKITREISSKEIQKMVEDTLMRKKFYETARSYIEYRYQKELDKKQNTTDSQILATVNLENEEVKQENSNKNPILIPTQRDYMAGLVSKDLTSRYLLPKDIQDAHKAGIIHFHDADYFVQKLHNCDLWNLDDMLQNGTVINGVKIDKPHSFLTACTIATQIMAIVASCQYGGQTISLSHLSPFVDVSRQKIRADVERELRECHIKMTKVKMNKIIEERVKKEIKDGVQTMQYQILTLNSTNGQTPFVSLNMYLGEISDPQGKDDLALVIEEVLNQRIRGIKNEKGVWVTPAFPKLLYVLEEDNIHKDSKYFYLTELAAKCTAKRMVPDYISEKIMKQNKINENGEGDCYPCMGCHQIDTPIIMYDGTKKLVQDVAVGDVIMGDDGTPRHVLELVHGEGAMYQVNQSQAEPYVVNGDHILSLVYHSSRVQRGMRDGDKVEIKVKDFLQLPKHIQLCLKGYKGVTKLSKKDFLIPPYILGLWLGDGCAHNGSFEVNENELQIADSIYEYANSIGMTTSRTYHPEKHTYTVRIRKTINNNKPNKFKEALKQLNLLDNKHVPEEYLFGSVDQRKELLAGLINTDGWGRKGRNRNTVCFGNTNIDLINKAKEVANSLGYRTNVILARKSSKMKCGTNKQLCDCSAYYHLSIRGFDSELLMEHKHPGKDKGRKDLNTSEITIAKVSDNDEYFGFNLDGNQLYLFNDGTVTHNCRSFLTPDRSISLGNVANALNYKEGKPKYYGRFNQGVVTINLVDLACSSKKNMEKFWQIFDERADLCHRALRIRHERLKGTPSDVAPILWQHGALARLKKGEVIDKLLYNGYSTISLGYAGLWECVYYMTGHKLTEPEGKEFGLQVMHKLNEYTSKWKAEENIDYSVYGTPIESTTYKFAKALQERFGIIEGVTDKNYITNSYHIKVTEPVNAFEKLKLESEFQRLSPGGAISYIETPNMQDNIPAVISVIQFIYDNIMYAELNTKSDYCQCCGYDGEIPIVEDENYKLFFKCPVCGNKDRDKMNIARRVCGYISTNEFNQGRTQEIKERVLHL